MKILITLALFFMTIYGSSFNYKMENNIKASTTSYEFRDGAKNDDINDKVDRVEYSNYLDVNLGKYIFISSGITAFNNSKEVLNKEFGDFYLDQSESGFYIEKLYGQVLLYEGDAKLSFAYGVMPLKGGNFKRFSRYNEERGNGLFTLINLSLEGGFLVYSNERHNLRIGEATWEDSFYNDENLGEDNGGSRGTFVFYDYTNGKHLLELNYMNAEFEKNDYSLGQAELYGIGYSYDDTEVSGWAAYTILGYSVYESNTLDWMENSGRFTAQEIGMIKMGNQYKPEEYNFNNDTWKGYSVLLGTKKLMDIAGKDVAVGVEYFKASDNWVSMNVGTANGGNSYGYWKHRGGNTFKIYNDIYLTKDLIIHTDYTYSYGLKAAKSGAVADTGDNENLNNFYEKESILSFELIYKF